MEVETETPPETVTEPETVRTVRTETRRLLPAFGTLFVGIGCVCFGIDALVFRD